MSNHQGYPNFRAVKASGVEGVIIKATEGRTYRNPNYSRQVNEARAAGLHVGHYHFMRGNPTSLEFENFVRNAAVRAADWVVLDAEYEGDTASVADFLNRLAHHYGRRPIFYSYAPWIRSHINPNAHDIARTADLWLAAYTTSLPVAPAPWTEWRAWQYTSSGSVPGIVGRVDMNDWRIQPHGSAAPSPAPTPTPTPTGGPFMALSDEQQIALIQRVENLHKHLLELTGDASIVRSFVRNIVKEELAAHGLRLIAFLDTEGVVDLDNDGVPG